MKCKIILIIYLLVLSVFTVKNIIAINEKFKIKLKVIDPIEIKIDKLDKVFKDKDGNEIEVVASGEDHVIINYR